MIPFLSWYGHGSRWSRVGGGGVLFALTVGFGCRDGSSGPDRAGSSTGSAGSLPGERGGDGGGGDGGGGHGGVGRVEGPGGAGAIGAGATPESEAGLGDAASAELHTLDLSGLDPAVVFKPVGEVEGLEQARADAAALLAKLLPEQKLAIVQGCEGTYVGNTAAAGPVPALTLQDGPAGVRGFPNTTAFPAPITLAASWDRELVRRWGAAMGAEHRGKGVMIQLGPMINLSRVPTAGRNFEGFGEDPFLSAELVGKEVEGIQSQKVVATAKHYVGNEQETNRMTESSQIDERTLHEVYYAPFEASVRAGAGAVMCAYNQVNGAFACENPIVLGDLKDGMGFSGFVMSDWGATHSTTAANAGLDMEMPSGQWFGGLASAVRAGTVSAARLDDMVSRILTSLLRVGVLQDPPTGTPSSNVASAEHVALAKEAATAGITLLRNEHSALPLGDGIDSIAVIGSAADTAALAGGGGSSEVTPPYVVTPLSAIRDRASRGVAVKYAQGDRGASAEEAVSLAKSAGAAVVFASVSSTEGEDRASLALPSEVNTLISRVAAANARTIVVLHTPGAVLMPWIDEVSAVLAAFYPGQENGSAVSSVIFGDTNPGGRLPVTFPLAEADLPSALGSGLVDYAENLGIGYRGLDGKGKASLFCFGHGLSYTSFEYTELSLSPGSLPGSVQVAFSVTNTGNRGGTETAQIYLGFPPSAQEPPVVLRGFDRVKLASGESRRVTVELDPRAFSCWDASAHARYVPSGTYRISVGRSSRDLPLQGSLDIKGLPAGAH